jgi:nitrate/TMAO reductase-like tetraheme cytochrome c subunit
MDEEQTNLPPPPRYRYKLLKIATLTLFFLALFASIGFTGLKATSSSPFCSSCHEMKPEVYTWKASTHSEVDCVNCHVKQGAKNLANEKKEVIVDAYKKKMGTYTAPIHMASEIPDSSCERCHNVNTREFTPSGDLIIPHDKHKNKGIECVQCHSGVAHGKIADRKMTFQADYDKWDQEQGTAAMADFKFIRPDMDTCIECHKARKVSTECSLCHKTGMIPKSHKEADFATETHGKQAAENLQKCNQCHNDMSKEKLEGYDEGSVLDKYLTKNGQSTTKNHLNYARENTFCLDCHIKKPISHDSKFINKHGKLANENQKLCLACHDKNKTSSPSINKTNTVYCSSCHPSSHSQSNMWRERHKIPIAENQKPSDFCYTCHSKELCTSCHKQ